MSELYHSGRPYRLWSKEAQARHRARFGHAPDEGDRKKWRERDSYMAEQRSRNAGKKPNNSASNPPLRQQPKTPAIEPAKKPYYGPHSSEEAWTKPAQSQPVSNSSHTKNTKYRKRETIVKKAVAKTKEEMRKKR